MNEYKVAGALIFYLVTFGAFFIVLMLVKITELIIDYWPIFIRNFKNMRIRQIRAKKAREKLERLRRLKINEKRKMIKIVGGRK